MTVSLDASPASGTATDVTAPPSARSSATGWSLRVERNEWVLAVLLWVVCVSYAALRLPHGWVPFDAGALGESAQRVLAGQLPHRDFDEIYTGGLSYLNALSFRLWGTSLMAMRITLLVAFALWLPAVYAIARRVAPKSLAIAVTLLAASWSIPVYPEAMPSWYNLFLATFGVAALFCYLDDGRRRWLVAAGVCAGLSCLIKIVGLYFVGAALLFLLYHDQDRALPRDSEGPVGRLGSVLVTLAASTAVAALLVLIRGHLTSDVLVQFILPGAALAALLVWREWRAPPTEWRARVAGLTQLGLPFVAGLLLPVALALIPYAAGGSLGALMHGVFVLPARRLSFAYRAPRGSAAFVVLAAAGLIIPRIARRFSVRGRREAEILFTIACVAVPIGASVAVVYHVAWIPMRVLIPLAAVWAAWHLARLPRGGADDTGNARIFLLAAATAWCGLVQFPFAVPNYFFYAGSLAALTAVALAARRGPAWRRLTGVCAAAYVAFAVVRIHSSSVFAIGLSNAADNQHSALPLARGGIRVSPYDSAMYGALVHELRAHSQSTYTYAGPDAPEVYFLSGLRNPTRTLFDFFDNSVGRTPRIMRELDARGVTAVAINAHGDFSGAMPTSLAAALEQRFPLHEQIGRFTLRWRE
ncbi:MAG TPA: glycosyltransferase family 39 protein, partial [Gemmatimonadaceae bacterium]|nr:glycosyltransferase family 39 protein [Gemmatimonadaceae bacterium]